RCEAVAAHRGKERRWARETTGSSPADPWRPGSASTPCRQIDCQRTSGLTGNDRGVAVVLVIDTQFNRYRFVGKRRRGGRRQIEADVLNCAHSILATASGLELGRYRMFANLQANALVDSDQSPQSRFDLLFIRELHE